MINSDQTQHPNSAEQWTLIERYKSPGGFDSVLEIGAFELQKPDLAAASPAKAHQTIDRQQELIKVLADALQVIRDSQWGEGESFPDRIADIKEQARAALAAAAKVDELEACNLRTSSPLCHRRFLIERDGILLPLSSGY